VTPPAWLLIALTAVAAIAALVPGEWPPAPWNLLGLVPLCLGLALALAAERQFVRAGTPVRPFTPAAALVTGGTFRLSRDPMYLGIVVLLAGWWIHRRFVAREERLLEERFGEQYRAYCVRVRRWL
jgi:protein-S-isoprenylcysteine O-methyltransferase Ste14